MPEFSQHAGKSFLESVLPDDSRISNDAPATIIEILEDYIQELVELAWEQAQANGRTTLQAEHMDVEQVPTEDSVQLPIDPVRRVSKSTLPENALVSKDAVLSIITIVEEYGETIIQCANLFRVHADRKTLRVEDINLYFKLFDDLPQ